MDRSRQVNTNQSASNTKPKLINTIKRQSKSVIPSLTAYINQSGSSNPKVTNDSRQLTSEEETPTLKSEIWVEELSIKKSIHGLIQNSNHFCDRYIQNLGNHHLK